MATVTASLPTSFQPEESFGKKHRESLLIALAIVVFALYPFVDKALGIDRLGSWGPILIYVILAMGLNVVVGYAGLLDLGYAAFFAIGAYTMGMLTSQTSYLVQQGWVPERFQHFWPALALSWVFAALFGLLLGAPTLRLRGDYLAIVTLGFGEIVPNFFLNAETITGGTAGINPIAKPPSITIADHRISFSPTDQRNWYWLILAVAIVSFFMIRRFYNSRLGRTWAAIREDEIAASSMGVNLVKTKLLAFAIGASFAGFAGSIYASYFQYVHPDNFQFSVSITILAMVVLGGLGNIYGAIVGALLIGFFDRILAEELNRPMHWLGGQVGNDFLAHHDLKQDKFLVFGVALVAMMLLRPEGLIPSARRKAELHPETADIAQAQNQQAYDVEQDQQQLSLGDEGR
jgi:branched-chain amino acid transport system permease protein